MRQLIILLVILLFAGCKQMPDVPTVISPYRIDIQQGNVVTQEMISKLKPGMTRAQVRFALGSPLIVDPFRADRWDYVYMYQKQGKETERRNIAVIFEEDKLVRIEGDVTALQPAARPAAPAAGNPPVKPPVAATPPAKSGGAKPDVKAVPADAPKADAAKPGTQAANPDADKEKPGEEKGFFGRMLDKIGF